MRLTGAAILLTALALSTDAVAQRAATPRPAPPVASEAGWVSTGEPLVFNGLVYEATRETRFFDPAAMTRVGQYRGVPVYVDALQQPHTIAYVPIGRGLMRAYALDERSGVSTPKGRWTSAVGPSYWWCCRSFARPAPTPAPPEWTHAQSIPPPVGNEGVWLEYEGRRWYSSGEAAVFSADRFVPIGNYRGFAVYRDSRQPAPNEIWVEVVKDGSVAPYTTR